MLALFRGFLSTWAARAFFVLLVGSFVLWGFSDVIRNVGGDTAVVVIGRERIEPQQLQDAFRNSLSQFQRLRGRPPSEEDKRQIAQITLEQLVQSALVADQARQTGLATPDEAVRQAVFAIPEFRGAAGQFDRNVFATVLQRNNLTEPRLLDFVRSNLLHDQLMEPARAGMAVPEILARRVYEFQNETRVADIVEVPFAAAAAPPDPSEADLRRIYDNNPGAYSAPEYRRIRAVILSADTIGRSIDVTDEQIAAAYQANIFRYVQPEKRAVQIVVAQDQAAAQDLAAKWRDGADWAAVEKDATAIGATALALPDSEPGELPTAELRTAVFAAAPDNVVGPAATPAGWQVVRVTHVTPAKNQPLDEVRDQVRADLVRPMALEQLPDRRRKLEDELSSVTTLEDLPAGLGVFPVVGTLDAQGNTSDGEPAPIPGSPAVRQAILTAAFQATPGALPVLVEGPEQTWFAISLEEASAPVLKPFDQVQAQLHADYETTSRRRTQEESAAKLLAAAKTSHSLQDAATVADLRVTRTPELHRGQPAEGVPLEVAREVFGVARNEPTMVQAGDAFYVAAPAEITQPDPAADPVALARIRAALTKGMQDDVEITYVNALRGRVQPRVNRDLFEQATK